MRKSQSSLEYMMTYGWAILIIVIVAGVLYSSGIFAPTSAAEQNLVTGFSGFQVTQTCEPGGVVIINIGDALGYTVNITNLSVNFNNARHYILIPQVLAPEQTTQLFVNNGCPSTSSTQYSSQVTINYTEPGQVFSSGYMSSGTFSGSTSSSFSSSYLPGSGAFLATAQNIVIPNSPTLNKMWNYSSVTIMAWIYDEGPMNSTSQRSMIQEDNGCTVGMWWLGINLSWYEIQGFGENSSIGNNPCASPHMVGFGANSKPVPLNKLIFAVVTWYSKGKNQPGGWIYTCANVQGAALNCVNNTFTNTWAGNLTGASMNIGSYCCSGYFFSGFVSDVQFYRTWLSAQQISTLYGEGPDGIPLSTPYLVAWYPLNGNFLDYSGNGNNANGGSATFEPLP